MSAYRRDFDETKYISFLIKDDELFKILEEVKSSLKREFNIERVYNEKCIRTKMKSYNGKLNTNFHSNKIPREGLFVD